MHFFTKNQEFAKIPIKQYRCKKRDLCNPKKLFRSPNEECAREITKLDATYLWPLQLAHGKTIIHGAKSKAHF